MKDGKSSRRALGGGASANMAAGNAATTFGASAAKSSPPKAVVVGVGAAGKSRIAYSRQMTKTDLAAPALPLLAWDVTPVAPNDGTYAAALSSRQAGWTYDQLFPKGGGMRVLYSVIAPGCTYDLHATASIDIVFVLSGSVIMGLDEGEVTLKAGDVVVQNATRHSWRVPADGEPCTLGGVVLAPDIGLGK